MFSPFPISTPHALPHDVFLYVPPHPGDTVVTHLSLVFSLLSVLLPHIQPILTCSHWHALTLCENTPYCVLQVMLW